MGEFSLLTYSSASWLILFLLSYLGFLRAIKAIKESREGTYRLFFLLFRQELSFDSLKEIESFVY